MSYRTAYIQTAFFVIASAFALAVLRFWPAQGDAPVAAVFPPGWSVERSFAAAASAGAAILSPGGWSNVVVVARQSCPTRFFARTADACAFLLDALGDASPRAEALASEVEALLV